MNYSIQIDDALVVAFEKRLSQLVPIQDISDAQSMLNTFCNQAAQEGLQIIQTANAQIIANALAQGMTPAQAAELIG